MKLKNNLKMIFCSKWEETALDKLGKIIKGIQKHKPNYDPSLFEGGTIPLVGCSEIWNNKRLHIVKCKRYYNLKGLLQSKLFEKNTLCISEGSDFPGSSSILKVPSCLSADVYGFKSFSQISDEKFLKYALDYPSINRRIMKLSEATSVNTHLNLYKLFSIKFPNPPYEFQRKIGDILSAYDELIESLEEQIEFLEKTRDSFYKEWFIKLRFPNFKNHSFIDGLPKNWKVMKLKDIAEIIKGTKPASYALDLFVGGGTKRLIHFLLVLLKLRDLLLTPMTLFHY